jgi:cytidine deaminase
MRVTYSELIEAAHRATKFSYAPYSGFRVGAAALTEGGDVVAGCNIENAAYSPTVCAERVAVFSARAQGKGKIIAIAIVSASGATCTPCGTCRQVLWELARDADIILEDGKGGYCTERLQALLPRAFGPENLGVDLSPVPEAHTHEVSTQGPPRDIAQHARRE